MISYLDNLFSLEGKVAIVTGASRGIGAAIAKGLFLAGATVIGLGRSSSSEVDGIPVSKRWQYYVCDITDEKKLENLIHNVYGKEEHIDILVNAAGITLPIQEIDSRTEKLSKFDKMIQVNLRSAYNISMLVASFMVNDNCSIINITSIGSTIGFPDNPGYVASKGGLRMLTKALSIDLASKGIRVNAIALGYFRTAMTAGSYANIKSRYKRYDRMIIKRYGERGEVIGAAIYLASNASSYMTGQDICIDGGWTAKGMN